MLQQRKVKALYGSRVTFNIVHSGQPKPIEIKEDEMWVESLHTQNQKNVGSKQRQKKKKTFTDYILISADSKWKSFFDIWILVLVGYSCFSSLFYVAFETPTDPIH